LTQRIALSLISLIAMSVAGCRQPDPAMTRQSETTLSIGWGLTAGTRVEPVAQIITQEGLVFVSPNGRPGPWLAHSWKQSDDGLTWRFFLKPGARFHDGSPANAEAVREALTEDPRNLGPTADNIVSIDTPSDDELVVHLKHRSALLPEALSINVPIHPQGSSVGTGPFYKVTQSKDVSEFRANDHYHEGRPLIDRVLIRQYPSVRAAWAEMLRGNVDMLYEVGTDALDLMKPAKETRVFAFQRPYAYVIILNLRKPVFRSSDFRRALNAAINRQELVSTALEGHGRPADGPMWPQHWTNDESLPRFSYSPKPVATRDHPISFTCLFSDPAYERIALMVKQQLEAIGVDVRLELTSIDEGFARAQSGDFDAWLADMALAPSFFRQSLFWQSGSSLNWGHYVSSKVDAALQAIDAAPDENAYKQGAAAFQRAMVDDPPGIFLAWSERDRAVNTRFDVHEEPGRDILTTMRLWQLHQPVLTTTHN
jgi:peptide/nickel transport system substrate-binding protein